MENNTTYTGQAALATTTVASFTTAVYLWMSSGLVITTISAFLVNAATLAMQKQNYQISNGVFIGLIITQFIIVIALAGFINKLSPALSVALFYLYCAFQGVFFGGVIFYIFDISSIAITFAVTAGTFGLVALYGYTTKSDLTKLGSLAIMGLIGIIIASIINVFAKSTGFELLINYIGILIFIGLIAYDSQKIKQYAAIADQTGKYTQMAVISAFGLYLDFINLFIRLLSLTGKRR